MVCPHRRIFVLKSFKTSAGALGFLTSGSPQAHCPLWPLSWPDERRAAIPRRRGLYRPRPHTRILSTDPREARRGRFLTTGRPCRRPSKQRRIASDDDISAGERRGSLWATALRSPRRAALKHGQPVGIRARRIFALCRYRKRRIASDSDNSTTTPCRMLFRLAVVSGSTRSTRRCRM